MECLSIVLATILLQLSRPVDFRLTIWVKPLWLSPNFGGVWFSPSKIKWDILAHEVVFLKNQIPVHIYEQQNFICDLHWNNLSAD